MQRAAIANTERLEVRKRVHHVDDSMRLRAHVAASARRHPTCLAYLWLKSFGKFWTSKNSFCVKAAQGAQKSAQCSKQPSTPLICCSPAIRPIPGERARQQPFCADALVSWRIWPRATQRAGLVVEKLHTREALHAC